MWADGAQQARPPIAAAQALVERLQRGELVADQMVLQELAGILQQSRCFHEPPFFLSQIQSQASASSRHARPMCANANAPSNLLSSACIGSLNIRGKLGGNVQDAASLINSVGLDILGIQETLHGDVDIPGFYWLAPARSPSAQMRLLVLPSEALVSWFAMSCTLLYPSAVDLLNQVQQMRFSGSRFLVKVDN
jgi:hypothetical protein